MMLRRNAVLESHQLLEQQMAKNYHSDALVVSHLPHMLSDVQTNRSRLIVPCNETRLTVETIDVSNFAMQMSRE